MTATVVTNLDVLLAVVVLSGVFALAAIGAALADALADEIVENDDSPAIDETGLTPGSQRREAMRP